MKKDSQTIKTKKTPERMCVVCREMKPKNVLMRLVLTENSLEIDDTGKKNGRGCYLCKNTVCVTKAVKSKNFSRQFGLPLTAELKEQLEKSIE